MNEEAREYMVEFGTDEEAEGDYRQDEMRQRELDDRRSSMKTYRVQWVRIEHQVWEVEIKAADEDEANAQAKRFVMSKEFEQIADDYEVVYAEEFINDIEEIEE